MTNTLHELIRRAREGLAGPDGRPVSFDWIAERAGLPRSTVHAIATRELHRLDDATRSRLAAIAGALGMDAARLEAAAVESLGFPVRVTYAELDGERELLVGAYEELDEQGRAAVLDFARYLRSQRRT